MTLKEERELLFDENFNCKSNDVEALVHFCDRLKKITGIQTCNNLGMMYEYLPEVYEGVKDKDLEESEGED